MFLFVLVHLIHALKGTKETFQHKCKFSSSRDLLLYNNIVRYCVTTCFLRFFFNLCKCQDL